MNIEVSKKQNTSPLSEQGFSLTEVLVSIALFAIVATSFMYSLRLVSFFRGKTTHSFLADQLASSKLEELTAIDPITLDNNDDLNEQVSAQGVDFTRVVDVTVNANGSRTVSVSVSSNNSKLNVRTFLRKTLFLWGER